MGVPLLDDGFDSRFTDALDCTQSEANITILIDAELLAAVVNVGSQTLYPHGTAFSHQLGNLVDA